MEITKTNVDLYRSLYWANQGLLSAARSLQQAEAPTSSFRSRLLNHNLQRVQTIISETRDAMNQILGEWMLSQE